MASILTVCGSLRAHSSNRAILHAYAQLAPDLAFTHYAGLGDLPHFNPDLDRDDLPLPAPVAHLRALVRSADALVLSTPEYAHGLPGAFKNALDWLVSDPVFPGKPVVILAADRGSRWAHDNLCEILRTMSAKLLADATALLPLGTNRVDPAAILADPACRSLLEVSVRALRTRLPKNAASNDFPSV